MEPEQRMLLVDGARAVLTGRREEGRKLLMEILARDENDEEAWLWLSGAVDSLDDIEVALDNCLLINPNNLRAIQGKHWLEEYRAGKR